MSRAILPALLLALALTATGCPLSPQTQLELDQARDRVAALQLQVDAAEATQAANTAHLKELLSAAEKKLATVEAKASDERVELTAGAVEEGAKAISPLLYAIFPGAAAAVGAIGFGAGAIRRKKAAKRKGGKP